MEGLEIRNFDSEQVVTDPLVEQFYKALDQGEAALEEFLWTKAGLWWFPILESKPWCNMFCNATHLTARLNAQQFREWVQSYRPALDYNGWNGYNSVIP
jgi:hypothetical protein